MFVLRSLYPRLYRGIALLALLALLAPIGVMAAHHPVDAWVRICGANNQKSDGQKSPAHQAPHCPICQSLNLLGGGFLLPDSAVFAVLSLLVAVAIFPGVGFILSYFLGVLPPARAPPLGV